MEIQIDRVAVAGHWFTLFAIMTDDSVSITVPDSGHMNRYALNTRYGKTFVTLENMRQLQAILPEAIATVERQQAGRE